MTNQTLTGYAAEREVELWRMAHRAPCSSYSSWCATSEPAYHRPTYWIDTCKRMAWERADRVEPRGVVPVPSAWGPSTTAISTHGRCA